VPRCKAPDHPDCWHECSEGVCVAFYEPETQLCITGCSPDLLTVGFVSAINRSGWSAITTADIRGLFPESLAGTARTVRAMASQEGAYGKADPEIATIARLIEEQTGRRRSVFPKLPLPKSRIDVAWQNSTLVQALRTMLKEARP
jgi:hypothetical protein